MEERLVLTPQKANSLLGESSDYNEIEHKRNFNYLNN